MTTPPFAIDAQNLGKRYQVGTHVPAYNTLRDSLVNLFLFRKKTMPDNIIWALQGVSFTVQQGEVVGIIGHNGAGKSTLLKILSKITHPTVGSVTFHGRVGALLEVGTGFHGELTGRENIFLNGAILGMKRREIITKFEAIVDFAGVAQFIDTPVKHYSTGMRLRLGFAVAAYLEPDILVVDEVLAVGDATFRKKCLGKMSDIATEGRTVLFVSHNLAAIQQLCPRSILLEKGRILQDGVTAEVLSTYLAKVTAPPASIGVDLEALPRTRLNLGVIGRITALQTFNSDGLESSEFKFSASFSVRLTCKIYQNEPDIAFAVGIDTLFGQRIITITSLENEMTFNGEAGQVLIGQLVIKDLLLLPGSYQLTAGLMGVNKGIDEVLQAAKITISEVSAGAYLVRQTKVGYLQLPNPHWTIGSQS